MQNGIMHNNMYKECNIESKTNSLRVEKPHWLIQDRNIYFAMSKSAENHIVLLFAF